MNPVIERVPEIAALAQRADFVDLRGLRGDVAFAELIRAVLTYRPTWIRYLFRCRSGLARLLGLKVERLSTLAFPEKNMMQAGATVTFFKVRSAANEHHWIGTASDKHLDAHLAFWIEVSPDGVKRYWTSTIVHYKHWTGPIYFNIIRPFHHLIVEAGVSHVCKQFGLRRVTDVVPIPNVPCPTGNFPHP